MSYSSRMTVRRHPKGTSSGKGGRFAPKAKADEHTSGQALHLYGTLFGDEVPELLASLDGKAVEAGDQWRQHVLVRQQAQADLVAVLP